MSIGKIGEFDVQNDDWQLYVDRLEQFFFVNKIPTEYQVPTLITVMGASSYELLVNLCTPAKPKTKTFAEISAIMQNHLQPKPSELAERFKFRNRKQQKGESISEYSAVLKKMSKSCEFASGLDESLRDQLVCGISSEVIRQRLFAESKLSFTTAYSLAVSMEAAERDAALVDAQGRSDPGGRGEREEPVAYIQQNRRRAGSVQASGRELRAARERRQRAAASRPVAASAAAQREQRGPCTACGGQHEVRWSVMSTDYSAEPAVNNLREYLRIRSVQPNINYDDCITFLRRQAAEVGLGVQVFELVPHKPVLLLTWEGEQPQLPSILLLSHMDVVPLSEEVWDYPPFDACLVDGRIYGRGVQDMKAQTIQHIEAIRALKRKNITLKRTIHVCCVPDEEIGGEQGMGTFAKSDAFKKLNVGFCVDEGSSNGGEEVLVYNGAKSIWHLNVICRGKPGHGSMMYANTCGDKIRYILDKFLDFRKESMQKIQSSGKPQLLALGDVVTANLTMLHGGTQNNVIPDKMVASFDLRLPPTIDWVQFENQIKQWCEEAGEGVTYEFEQKDPISPPISLDASNNYWTAFKGALHKLNIPFKLAIFPAGNDSRFVRQQKILALGFTPMRFTEVGAHSRNESLLASVFLEGIKIFEEVIHALCDS